MVRAPLCARTPTTDTPTAGGPQGVGEGVGRTLPVGSLRWAPPSAAHTTPTATPGVCRTRECLGGGGRCGRRGPSSPEAPTRPPTCLPRHKEKDPRAPLFFQQAGTARRRARARRNTKNPPTHAPLPTWPHGQPEAVEGDGLDPVVRVGELAAVSKRARPRLEEERTWRPGRGRAGTAAAHGRRRGGGSRRPGGGRRRAGGRRGGRRGRAGGGGLVQRGRRRRRGRKRLAGRGAGLLGAGRAGGGADNSHVSVFRAGRGGAELVRHGQGAR